MAVGRVISAAQRSPAVVFGVAGFIAAAVTVVGGGRIRSIPGTTPSFTWFGLQTRSSHSSPVWGIMQTAGILALLGLWIALIRISATQRWPQRPMWCISAAWGLPFLIGPPLLSADVYSYAAQGLLVKEGFDPYVSTPTALGLDNPALLTVDPAWRNVHSPYGPLATLMQHLAAILGGGPVGTVILMRLLAAISVVAIGVFAVALATEERKRAVIALTVANPLVLLQLLSAAHLEAPMAALVLAALLAARHGRMEVAVLLGCAAGAIKAPGMVVALVVLCSMWHPSERASNIRLLRASTVGAATWAALTLLVPHGWGWISALGTPGLGHTPGAPSTLVASLLSPIIPVAGYDDLAAGGRAAATGAGLCLLVYLLATARHRSITVTTGLCLFCMTAFGPVLYPWYLTWGILAIVPAADRRHREWLIALSAFGSTTIVLGLPRDVAIAIVAATDVIILLGVIWTELAYRTARRLESATSPAI